MEFDVKDGLYTVDKWITDRQYCPLEIKDYPTKIKAYSKVFNKTYTFKFFVTKIEAGDTIGGIGDNNG